MDSLMNRLRWLCFLSVIALIFNSSCSPALPVSLPEKQARKELLTETLIDGKPSPSAPVHNDYFTPRAGADPALHTLNGTLQLAEFTMQDNIPTNTPRSESRRYFPGFEMEFFTSGDYLVPADREITPSTGKNSYWSLILSPGKVWSEPGDAGMSRAAFPFLLVGQDYNNAHNGLATFLFDDETVSQLYFQITQETAAWNRYDYWGQTVLTYTPHALENEASLKSQFNAELSAQLPIRPWTDLKSEVDQPPLSAFNGDLDAEDISQTGLVMNETLYLQPAMTRSGVFPFPHFMRHGVFSVTKSMGAAVALLRLAQKYGDEVFDLKITDYVADTSNHNGWDGVTFAHALNMATGIGEMEQNRNSSHVTADEDHTKFS